MPPRHAVARLLLVFAALLLLPTVLCEAAHQVYYADPSTGNDNNDGLSSKSAWKSLDRGQPTQLRVAASAGATNLTVRRAVQLPAAGLVGLVFGTDAPPGLKLRYTHRDAFTLFGISLAEGGGAVPALPRGAMVHCLTWPPPARGSTIAAAAGVFAFPPNDTSAAALDGASYDAAYIGSPGLTLQGTVSSTGRPLSIIDGRDISKTALTVDGACCVTLRGFDIRRGTLYVNEADNFSVSDSRMHGSVTGISIGYSNFVRIVRCKVFDNTEGAQADGIAVHRGVDHALIVNNTISNNDCCLRVYPGSQADVLRPGLVIQRNVLTRCTDLPGLVAEPGVQLVAVSNNNIWLTGKGGGLKDLSPHSLELQQYYAGINQSARFSSQNPDDLHEDPQIVSWDEDSPDFLCVAAGSASALHGIGACASTMAASRPATETWQGVINGDFSAGMWSWQGHTFPDNPNAQGLPIWHPESASWEVTSDGCAPYRAPCAKLSASVFPNGTIASTRFRSAAFDITRTWNGMNLTLGVSVKGSLTNGARASACITVTDFDDIPTICQPLLLTGDWARHEINFTVPSWMPATVAAAFTITGAPITLYLDDVELRQSSSSAACDDVVNLLLADPSALWKPGSEVTLTARPSATCTHTSAMSVAVHHRLVNPNGLVLSVGSKRIVVGQNYTILLPSNATGGTLLMVSAHSPSGKLVANLSHRLLIAGSSARVAPEDVPSDGEGFSFCSTIEWHVQAALLNNGLLDKQLATHRALGITCHHVYLDSARMMQMLTQPFVDRVADSYSRAGVTFLFTLLPNAMLNGKCGQLGAPCATSSVFPVSRFCKDTVARVPPSVPSPRPGKTTAAQLERVCELSRRMAQKMGPVCKFWAVDGEPQSNGLVPGEYAERVLPVMSVAVRDGAGAKVVIIGGGIVNGFRDTMWNNTISHHKYFDAFAFHPYRFARLDPEASCLGLCGSSFRSQLLTANQDLRRAGGTARVYLTEEASGVTKQRTRAIGWSPYGGFDLSARLATFSQQELINANHIARMWVTAIGEGAIGYNLHGGDENLMYLDDMGTPLLGTVAIHTMAVVLGLGRSRPVGRLFNDTERLGPGPGPGNVVPLPTGPFRGYLFESTKASSIVAAVWLADSEFGTVGSVTLSRLSEPQLRSVSVYNAFGNVLATRVTNGGLDFMMGRDVLYIVFESVSTAQVRDALSVMFSHAIPQVRGSVTWPSPFW